MEAKAAIGGLVARATRIARAGDPAHWPRFPALPLVLASRILL